MQRGAAALTTPCMELELASDRSRPPHGHTRTYVKVCAPTDSIDRPLSNNNLNLAPCVFSFFKELAARTCQASINREEILQKLIKKQKHHERGNNKTTTTRKYTPENLISNNRRTPLYTPQRTSELGGGSNFFTTMPKQHPHMSSTLSEEPRYSTKVLEGKEAVVLR